MIFGACARHLRCTVERTCRLHYEADMKTASGWVSLWTWVEITLVSIIGCALQAVMLVLCAPFDRNRVVAGRMFRLMGATAARLAPTWKFGIHGQYPQKLPSRTIVVSNHA